MLAGAQSWRDSAECCPVSRLWGALAYATAGAFEVVWGARALRAETVQQLDRLPLSRHLTTPQLEVPTRHELHEGQLEYDRQLP